MANKSKGGSTASWVLGEHELRAFVHREMYGGRLRCVFGYDNSGCTSALGGHAGSERTHAGQLARRTAQMNFLQTQIPGWCILGSCYGAPLVGVRCRCRMRSFAQGRRTNQCSAV